MKKLEKKIKEVNTLQLEEAVTTAHETSDAFSEATLKEQLIFQGAKEAEMKDTLGLLADGHIEMYKSVRADSFRNIQLTQMKCLVFLGYQGVGENNPYFTTDTSRRLRSTCTLQALSYIPCLCLY